MARYPNIGLLAKVVLLHQPASDASHKLAQG